MVSIIIVTMGADRELAECIASIKLFIKASHEIIVVNNSAQDISIEHTDIIIENGRNLGFARAVNRGIRASMGEIILLLNPDTKFEADTVTPAEDFMKNNERAGICGIQLVFPDGRLQNSVDIVPNLLNQFINRSLLKLLFTKSYPSKRSGYQKPVKVPSVIGAFMMIKRRMLDEIGILDEGFFFYLEETDLCKRAADFGYEVWHLPQLRLMHYQGLTARKYNISRSIEFIRSMHRFFYKHSGPASAFFYSILTAAKSFIEVIANAPVSFVEKARQKMVRSASVMTWLIAGMPDGFGLEKAKLIYSVKKWGGYTWHLPEGRGLPGMLPDVMLRDMPDLLNSSRTTYIKKGELSGEEVYLKRYNFKGVKDAFKNLFRKSRALRAMEAALVVGSVGLDTPEVIFACEKRFLGILLKSYIATSGIKAKNLVQTCSDGTCPDSLVKNAASYIRRMHETGVVHIDMKGENLLVDDAGNFFLIDLDRMKRRHYPDIRMIARNLSYLNASFSGSVETARRLEFLKEYSKGNPSLIAARQKLIGLIDSYTDKRLKRRYQSTP